MDITHAQRVRPKKIRPKLSDPVADRLWDYCNKHGLMMHVVLTSLAESWLDEQEAKDQIAS